MLRLHDYPASANCFKVRLLLAQLGQGYERVAVDIFDGDTLTDEFARLNPQRSTPVLELADGRALIESNAILWYLASGSPLLPDDPFEQAEVCRWLIYEQSDVMPSIGGLRFRLVTGRLAPEHLQTRPFLVADRYTIADVAVYAYAHLAEETGFDTSPFASFRAWLHRVAAQPGFVDDLAPYPPNAAVLAGRSTYG